MQSTMNLQQEEGENLVVKYVRNYTDRALEDMSYQDLYQFTYYNPGFFTKGEVAEHIKQMIKDKPPSMADRVAAMKLLSSKRVSERSHSKPDEAVNTKGGQFLATKEAVILPKETVPKRNAIVPVKEAKDWKYPSQERVAIFISQVITVNNAGSWVPLDLTSMKPVMGDTVNVMGTMATASFYCDALNGTQRWKNLSLQAKKAVSGPLVMEYVMRHLGGLSPSGFYFLQTMILMTCLRVLNGDKYANGFTSTQFPSLNNNMAQRIGQENFNNIIANFGVPDILEWETGVRGSLKAAVPTNAKQLINLVNSCVAFGGSGSTVATLQAMKGYSYIMTALGRRVCWVVSTVLGLGKGSNIDIRTTLGDIALLHGSLSYHMGKHHGVDGDYIGTKIKYIIEDSENWNKIPDALVQYCSQVRRQDSILVAVMENQFPSADKSGAIIDYEARAKAQVSYMMQQGHFVVRWKVWGSYWWGSGVRQNSTNNSSNVDRQFYVFEWGDSSEAIATLSTLPSLTMIGYAVNIRPKIGVSATKSGLEGEQYTSTNLKALSTVEDWYDAVSKACADRIGNWLAPEVRYNPIGNLLYQTSKGVDHANSIAFGNETGIDMQHFPIAAPVEVSTGESVPKRQWGASAQVATPNAPQVQLQPVQAQPVQAQPIPNVPVQPHTVARVTSVNNSSSRDVVEDLSIPIQRGKVYEGVAPEQTSQDFGFGALFSNLDDEFDAFHS